MISIVIIIISLLLDGLLTNYLPFLVNNLSLFTPLFTLISISIIYPFYRKKEKEYYSMVFIIGIIYDLCYTNLLFLNAIMFLIIAIVSKYIYKNFEITFFRLIVYTIIIITIYEFITAGIIGILGLVPITIERIIYKITHSIVLNVIYVEIIYLILKLIPKKYKKISIN